MKIATLRCLLRNLFSQQPAGNYVEGNVKVHRKHIAVSLSVIANNFLQEFQLALTSMITNKAKIVCFPKHHHHRAFIHSQNRAFFVYFSLSLTKRASEYLYNHTLKFFSLRSTAFRLQSGFCLTQSMFCCRERKIVVETFLHLFIFIFSLIREGK